METKDIVIRELRHDDTREAVELILSGLFQETLTLRNAFGLMLNAESCLSMTALSAILYTLSHSLGLSVILPPLLSFLVSFVYLWCDYRQYVLDSRSELQDLHGWYTHKPDRKFWVAVYREKVIGTVALQMTSETTAELQKMRVHLKYRRRGVGTRMVEHVEDYCRSVGTREVFMIADDFGHGAYLYQRCGYVITVEFLRRIVPLPGAFFTVRKLSKKL
ncbi:putative N-acetyltransferase 14 [Branchiostoma floridae x Branchiostoma japonicum]